MARIRRYGPWPSRGVRFLAFLLSAIAMLRIWWLMTWHRKMWLLWAWENVPDDRRPSFAQAIARAVVRVWVEEMSSSE